MKNKVYVATVSFDNEYTTQIEHEDYDQLMDYIDELGVDVWDIHERKKVDK